MSKYDDEIELRRDVLIAFQEGLLGAVTPNLRGVVVKWSDTHISGEFIYDGNVSELEEELVSEVEGLVIACFNSHTIELVAKGGAAEVSLDQISLGAWVYRRFE